MALWRASANRVEEWARRQSLGSDSKKVRRRSRRVRFENVPHSGPADTPGSLCEREGGGKRRGVRKKKVESVGKDSRTPLERHPDDRHRHVVSRSREHAIERRDLSPAFRFVSRSRSPPRPRGRRLTLVGLMALVVAFILEQFSQARVVLAIVLSSSRRGGAWLVASPSPIWAPESLSRRSPQEDHTERKSLFRQRRLPRMLKKALSVLSACMGRVVWGAKDFLQPTRSQPLVTHSPVQPSGPGRAPVSRNMN